LQLFAHIVIRHALAWFRVYGILAQLSTPESEHGLPCLSQYQENITCGMLGIGSFETIGASEKAGSSEKFEKVGITSYVG
jgi:hypothetical protein